MLDEPKAMEIVGRITREYELKDSERNTFAVLLLSSGGKAECSLPVREIAEMSGFSRSGVRRAVRSLEKKGLVKREARFHEEEHGARAANRYILRLGRRTG
ncbi:MAG: helix-turn-helix domain-containing protein [Synergistaceae bacterium]|jgi:predicted transcriptional regulator|nr:helix-turn-helix domain-containing protein [Synergistaceae bacterium]